MRVTFFDVQTWRVCYLLDRKCLKDNEENKKQVLQSCRKHEKFLAALRDSLDPEKKNEKASDEDLILKVFVWRLKRL